MATTSGFYTIASVARAIGTYHARVRYLLDVGGIVPSVVGGYQVLTVAQFREIRKLHRTVPKKKTGPRAKMPAGSRHRGDAANQQT
jgi:hypothetical protein